MPALRPDHISVTNVRPAYQASLARGVSAAELEQTGLPSSLIGDDEASVHGRAVIVAGRVIGDITADDKIELQPTAEVDGDITAPRILIEDGATFRGKVTMKPPEPRHEPAASSARKAVLKVDKT